MDMQYVVTSVFGPGKVEFPWLESRYCQVVKRYKTFVCATGSHDFVVDLTHSAS